MDDDSNCVMMVSSISGISIAVFVCLRLTTDYLIMTFILVRFSLNKINNQASFISSVNEDKQELFAERDYTQSSIFN